MPALIVVVDVVFVEPMVTVLADAPVHMVNVLVPTPSAMWIVFPPVPVDMLVVFAPLPMPKFKVFVAEEFPTVIAPVLWAVPPMVMVPVVVEGPIA